MAVGDVAISITTPRAFNCNVFDGVDDYVEIPHNDTQLGANLSNGFTISAWANPRSYGETTGRILDKSSSAIGVNGFSLHISATTKYVFRINNVGANSGTIAFGTWAHILVTATATGTANIYINGVLSGTANQSTANVSAITTTNAMRIGQRSPDTAATFDGAIRSVKMWNRVLTTDEIAQDYAGDSVSFGLIHHFKLGGDYADYGSVGVTATNSGSIAAVIEDNVAVAVQAARAAASISGANLITSLGAGRQVCFGKITE